MPAGDLHRAVRALTTDTLVGLDARRKKHGFDELGEMAQQFQIEIEGVAAEMPSWSSVEVIFDIEFMGATEQRYSNLLRPNFGYGVVLEAGPVFVQAHVTEWLVNDLGFYEGATIQIGAFDPNGPTPYNGSVDLTFQGFGAPQAVPPDDLTVG